MILAVDVGNSNITVGLFDMTGKLAFLSSLGTNTQKTTDQCAVDLLGIFGLHRADIASVSGAILSCVVPPMQAIMSGAIARLTGRPPMVVGPGIKTGLNIKAEIHNQLGSDIVASSVAAIAKYPGSIVVIDMGTATSMSLLKGSVYEGCIIMPGVHLALEALWSRAAALPPISVEAPAHQISLLGRTTEEAMRSGILYGHASMVDGMIDRLALAAGGMPTVVATGGNAPSILPYCRHPITYNEYLVMDGLYLLYQKNAERHRK